MPTNDGAAWDPEAQEWQEVPEAPIEPRWGGQAADEPAPPGAVWHPPS